MRKALRKLMRTNTATAARAADADTGARNEEKGISKRKLDELKYLATRGKMVDFENKIDKIDIKKLSPQNVHEIIFLGREETYFAPNAYHDIIAKKILVPLAQTGIINSENFLDYILGKPRINEQPDFPEMHPTSNWSILFECMINNTLDNLTPEGVTFTSNNLHLLLNKRGIELPEELSLEVREYLSCILIVIRHGDVTENPQALAYRTHITTEMEKVWTEQDENAPTIWYGNPNTRAEENTKTTLSYNKDNWENIFRDIFNIVHVLSPEKFAGTGRSIKATSKDGTAKKSSPPPPPTGAAGKAEVDDSPEAEGGFTAAENARRSSKSSDDSEPEHNTQKGNELKR